MGGDANNNTILTTVENLPSTFELSFDFKTTGESRFYIGASDYATDRNPNYSVFIGSPNGSNKCYYGTRTTSTSATDITLDPTTYHSMKITRRGSTFIFNLDGKQYSTTVTWFDNYTTYKIGINIWGNGTVYCKNVKLLTGNIDSYVRDWGKNYRIGVFNNPIAANITNYNVIDKDGETTSITYDTTNYDNLTINDIIQNAEYWSDTVAKLGTFHDLNVTFPYNRDYPLYIIITGDYSSATYPASVRFTEPCIIEATEYLGREPNGNYLEPIRNLLTTNESTINIGTYESSAPFVFYDFDVGEDYGTNTEMAIRGIGIELTIENYDNCVLSAQLRSPTGTIGERSVDIEASMLDENNILRIGGIGDTWNFNTLDLVDLADWEIRLTLLNILTETETTISADNAQLIFYVEQVTSQRDFAYINGEDIRYYGAFVSDIDIPAGLKMSTSFLNVDGTDTNDAYRQNIREKEITLELEIGDNCDLEMATNSLRQLTQLILNKRDKYNRPIPKTISFSFMPDVYFEYIVEDTFDNPIEISSYNIKVKLTVPSGTAYKKNATTTNTTGYVQGLAKVNPIISIKPTGTEIEVKETQTNQKWNITLPETPEGIIVIDTENRKAYTQTDEDSTDQTDISKYVDFNSDWFILQDEYTFTSNNAYIRSVTYTERW